MRSESQNDFSTRRDLSVENMKARFKEALRIVGVPYNSLTVDGLLKKLPFSVGFDLRGNIGLSYNPDLLSGLTAMEVEGLLYYEACYAVAVPCKVTLCTEDGGRKPYVAEHFGCYKEYLALAEFVRRFKGTEIYGGLRSAHLRLLDNFDEVICSLRQRLIPDRRILLDTDLYAKLEAFLSSIVYDSMFFLVGGDMMFLDRCVSIGVRGLHRFAEWIYEDFEYISSLALPLEETVDAVMLSSKLSCCVEPRCLMLRGEIVFYPEFLQFTLDAERKNVKWATNLAAAWQKRLRSLDPAKPDVDEGHS